MAKTVTKDGKKEKTYFLYDGNNVIMEADEEDVTAKNTYAGPLLLRTEFNGADETTYEYMYNAHGDVVTLLSDGEVVATYYYDSFGNILEQTGEVSNSILYAGYQYDEETGLYYINARMYDPVTARFLQADTYAGSIDDPLSLNLYTYCLNNPQKYVDPSGHFAILPFIIIGLVAAGIGAGMEYISQKYIEKREVIDYRLVIYEGVFNAIIAVASMGTANLGVAAARQAGKLTFRTIVKTVAVEVAFGTVEGAVNNVGRQMVTGTSIDNLDYDEIASSAALGGFTGGLGGAAGVGLDALKQTRVVRKMVEGAKGKIADVANILSGSNTRIIPGIDGVVTGGDSTKLGKNMMEAMGLKRGTKWTGYQAQHIIPVEMADHQVLQKIGMDLDDASNGIFLRIPSDDVGAMSRHRGYHSVYSDFVKSQLDAMDINQSSSVLQQQVLDLQNNLRRLQQNGLPLYSGQGASVDLWQRNLNKLQ